MFEILKNEFAGFAGLQICNKKTGESITVFPGFGGMLHQITLQKHGTLRHLLDSCADAAEMRHNKKARGAKLFPFANRVRDGRYSFAGKIRQLPLNWPQEGHAIHGFIRDKSLDIVAETIFDEYAEIILSHAFDGQYEGYPFPFFLEISYRLTSKPEVIISTKVTNTGSDEMPCTDGWHCYFKSGATVDVLEMQLPPAISIGTDGRGIPNGTKTTDSGWRRFKLIGNTFIDNGFRILENTGKVTTKLFDRKNDMMINIWQETGAAKYNYLQLYTQPARKSIAVEPMTSATDAFNNGEGLLVLQPEHAFQAAWGVYIS